ncbi:MAG: HD domain-containing protein [Bryobacterales bacterium]|nr:HD domain-containing protein [Bryobacterales bacterium]
MATLEDAIALAALAHKGQLDKAGAPYILHPLRMMLRLAAEDERIVAVLHDVVEDTGWTFADLREAGFAETIVEAVDAMTHREGESYEDFVLRAGRNPVARRVKLADLDDNSDASRLPSPLTDKDRARLEKYARARAVLLAAVTQ